VGYGRGLHARSTVRQTVPENSFLLLVSVSQIFERLSAGFQYAALHDSSTGLPNRRQLEERGSASIEVAGDLS
jgi:GGDEF domain-containing protein